MLIQQAHYPKQKTSSTISKENYGCRIAHDAIHEKSAVSFERKLNTNKNIPFGANVNEAKGFFASMEPKLGKFFRNSKWFHWWTEMGANNSVFFEDVTAVAIACSIRPLSVIFTPGGDKRDKQYAAAQSIASGITGFLMSMVFYVPFGRQINRFLDLLEIQNMKQDQKSLRIQISEYLKNSKDILDEKVIATESEKMLAGGEDKAIFEIVKAKVAKAKKHLSSEALNEQADKLIQDSTRLFTEKSLELFAQSKQRRDSLRTIINMGTKFIMAPLIAYIMVSSISPVMKRVFPKKENNKIDNTQSRQVNFKGIANSLKTRAISQNVFKGFVGKGVK